jgi:hypothetical protein
VNRRTKRVARHKINDSKGLSGVNIGLTYVLVDFEESVQSQLADGRWEMGEKETGGQKMETGRIPMIKIDIELGNFLWNKWDFRIFYFYVPLIPFIL